MSLREKQFAVYITYILGYQNNIANFHKSTTVASACFRQIKKPIQIESNELDVIGIIYFYCSK